MILPMLGILIWVVGWWITDVIPIGITSLLPIILFPLTGIASSKLIAGFYINEIIFLFMGGFIMALALEKWDVHKRIALKALILFGKSPTKIIIGFMLICAFLSMWISNTATTLLMLPIAMSVNSHLKEIYGKDKLKKFHIALFLGIAYACSIGGIATLIGTPPNLVFTKIFSDTFPMHSEVSFSKWFFFSFPISFVMLLLAMIVLIKLFVPKLPKKKTNKDFFENAYKKLGKITFEQKVVLILFVLFAVLLIFRSDIEFGKIIIPGWERILTYPELISDAMIALLVVSFLYVIPTKKDKKQKLMDWKTTVGIPWEILFLFGGGFALANGFQLSGLLDWLSIQMQVLQGFPTFLMLLMISLFMTFITEFTSNTASTQALLPVVAALAISLNIHPLLVMLPLTISASLAFMFPVATPPNAIVFSTKQFKMKSMLIPGFILNLLGTLVVSLITYYWGSLLFDFGF